MRFSQSFGKTPFFSAPLIGFADFPTFTEPLIPLYTLFNPDDYSMIGSPEGKRIRTFRRESKG
jgi:hypothetical protein